MVVTVGSAHMETTTDQLTQLGCHHVRIAKLAGPVSRRTQARLIVPCHPHNRGVPSAAHVDSLPRTLANIIGGHTLYILTDNTTFYCQS